MSPPEFLVAGARIHALRIPDAISIIDEWIKTKHKDYIVLLGAHGIVEMQSDPKLLEINNRAGLTTPDGMSVVWMGRMKGHRTMEKVYAPDIMEETFKVSAARGYRHFFYGGTEGIAERLSARLRERFPGIDIVGTYFPPFRPLTEEEVGQVVKQINESKADIVWVGLGCPKQDHWMDKFRPMLEAPVLIGVGAGFDFLSGQKPLAPKWIQRSGFEWLYRMLSEPKRLWPRYSRVVPKFIYLAMRDLLRPANRGPKDGSGRPLEDDVTKHDSNSA